jgi:hypothetical protein
LPCLTARHWPRLETFDMAKASASMILVGRGFEIISDGLTGHMGRFDTVGSPSCIGARAEMARRVLHPFGVAGCEACALFRFVFGRKSFCVMR